MHVHDWQTLADIDGFHCMCGQYRSNLAVKLAPKHPVTKQKLLGGFDPLSVSQTPFGYRETVSTAEV